VNSREEFAKILVAAMAKNQRSSDRIAKRSDPDLQRSTVDRRHAGVGIGR
jgi:hypothetical protein